MPSTVVNWSRIGDRGAFDLGTAVRAAVLWAAMACAGEATASTSATAIRFVAEPADVVTGETFSIKVEAVDAAGHRVGRAASQVALSLDSGDPISGPTSVAMVQGVASFDGLVATRPVTAAHLNAESDGLSAVSAPFRVSVGSPSPVRSTFSPESVVVSLSTAVPVVFSFVDVYGNPLSRVPVSVMTTLDVSRFSPGSGTTAYDGTFATTLIGALGGVGVVHATLGATPMTFTAPIVATEFCKAPRISLPGTVAGTLPAGTCDVAGSPATVYRFATDSAGAVALTPSRGFRPRIEIKTGLTERSVSFEATAAVPTIEWLLPEGKFLVRLAAITGPGGPFTLQGAMVPGNSGVAARAIITSGTYTGQTLSLSDRAFGDGTVYDYFLINSTRSCTITMRSAAFDSYLVIEDAVQQQTLVEDDNSAGGKDARVHLDACNDGGNPLGILANSNLTPQQTAGVGPYVLIVDLGPELPAMRSSITATAQDAPPDGMRLAPALRSSKIRARGAR